MKKTNPRPTWRVGHSALFRDSVLDGPTEVKITIRDREPGHALFSAMSYVAKESAQFATVVLERKGGEAEGEHHHEARRPGRIRHAEPGGIRGCGGQISQYPLPHCGYRWELARAVTRWQRPVAPRPWLVRPGVLQGVCAPGLAHRRAAVCGRVGELDRGSEWGN